MNHPSRPMRSHGQGVYVSVGSLKLVWLAVTYLDPLSLDRNSVPNSWWMTLLSASQSFSIYIYMYLHIYIHIFTVRIYVAMTSQKQKTICWFALLIWQISNFTTGVFCHFTEKFSGRPRWGSSIASNVQFKIYCAKFTLISRSFPFSWEPKATGARVSMANDFSRSSDLYKQKITLNGYWGVQGS